MNLQLIKKYYYGDIPEETGSGSPQSDTTSKDFLVNGDPSGGNYNFFSYSSF